MAEATAVSFRKGTDVEHETFRGVKGEVTVDLTDLTVWVHPGNNERGNPLARADMKNVATEDIASRDIARADLTNISISNVDLPGIKLKLDIPTKTSQLENDSGFITDVSTVVGNATINIKKNNVSMGTFTTNSFTNTDINIPVPTTTNELTNNSGFITNTVNDLVNYTKTSDLPAAAKSGDYDDLVNKPVLAAVATSGSYTDLLYAPQLADVATTGSYDDLIDKPNIVQPVQSDWLEEDNTKLEYIQNRPNLIMDVVVTPLTGVVTIALASPYIVSGDPTATPLAKELVGGATISGTWTPVANTNKKEWTFTPTVAGDILENNWVIFVN